MTGSQVSTARERPKQPSSRAAGVDVLDALGDADCRTILAAVDETPQSAAELATACDLPLSTTYRKVNRLESAGLLEASTRVDPSRNHESEYAAASTDVCVSVGGDGGVTVTISGDERASHSYSVSE